MFAEYAPPPVSRRAILVAAEYFVAATTTKEEVNQDFLAYAADSWHAVAQYELALIYRKAFRGDESLRFLMCSGSQGYAPALFRLYSTYFNRGDYPLAYLLCQAAAKRGHEEAQFEQLVFAPTGSFEETNLQAAVTNAVELAANGNKFAKEYIDVILRCTPNTLRMRMDDDVTDEDLAFLRKTIGFSRVDEDDC